MKNTKKITRILTPSSTLNAVAAIVAIVSVASVVTVGRYQVSGWRLEVVNSHATVSDAVPHSTQAAYSNITTNFAHNHVLGSAPLFILWGCVGLIVYYATMSIVRSLQGAAELHDELGYEHVTRQALLHEALLKLIIRVAATIGWLISIKLSISVVVPYALSLAAIAAQDLGHNWWYTLPAMLVIYVDFCVHVVFLRLITLRPRLFGSASGL